MSEVKKKPKSKWLWITLSAVAILFIYLAIALTLWLNALLHGVGDAASGFAEFIFPLAKN